ncbi:hypothetical protein NPIL_176502 [Nephila pilipes]|uniref:Uncharacterized protein n=1 Tax=Nephila pilipes TaxID=299642 RepID=A0A8X6NVH7_NEPPI|nr:hypothetical protein NPIL_176502 [Nephila pilipes]
MCVIQDRGLRRTATITAKLCNTKRGAARLPEDRGHHCVCRDPNIGDSRQRTRGHRCVEDQRTQELYQPLSHQPQRRRSARAARVCPTGTAGTS